MNTGFCGFSAAARVRASAFAPGRAIVLCAAALLCGTAGAQPVPAADAPAAAHAPLKADPAFARFARYTGTIGTRQVELLLGPKSDEPAGLHGEYHVLDTGAVILVAGDRDGETLELEESDDGTRISGEWVAKLSPDGVLSGDHMNPDESDSQPIALHLAAPAASN